MKKVIAFIIGVVITISGRSQYIFGLIKTPGGGGGDTSLIPALIATLGESNGGGLAANSYATSPELAARAIRIFNNNTNASFDPLDIGSNNLVGHVGLGYASATGHGIELQLANRYDDGDFSGRYVRLVKAAQGGTTVANWDVGGTYTAESQTISPFDTAIRRFENAISLVQDETGKTPTLEIFTTIGINDYFAGTSEATFKSKLSSLIDRIRGALPGVTIRFYITKLQSIFPTYDAVIGEIAAEKTGVYVINTTGFETAEVVTGAIIHWGYTGMKGVSNAFIDLVLSNL